MHQALARGWGAKPGSARGTAQTRNGAAPISSPSPVFASSQIPDDAPRRDSAQRDRECARDRPTLLVGSLEFVGLEEKGWKLAGTIVPIAYIAWSLWLMTTGLVLLIT
jgi:hypothetical protein